MKSILLTILIFAGVFLFVGSDVLSVLGQDWFQYTSYATFAIVMLAGVYVTMFRKPAQIQNDEQPEPPAENLQIEQKEEEHDEE